MIFLIFFCKFEKNYMQKHKRKLEIIKYVWFTNSSNKKLWKARRIVYVNPKRSCVHSCPIPIKCPHTNSHPHPFSSIFIHSAYFQTKPLLTGCFYTEVAYNFLLYCYIYTYNWLYLKGINQQGEASYKMPQVRARVYAVRGPEDAAHSNTIRAALAEFLSTFIFVFAGEGSVLALGIFFYSH